MNNTIDHAILSLGESDSRGTTSEERFLINYFLGWSARPLSYRIQRWAFWFFLLGTSEYKDFFTNSRVGNLSIMVCSYSTEVHTEFNQFKIAALALAPVHASFQRKVWRNLCFCFHYFLYLPFSCITDRQTRPPTISFVLEGPWPPLNKALCVAKVSLDFSSDIYDIHSIRFLKGFLVNEMI